MCAVGWARMWLGPSRYNNRIASHSRFLTLLGSVVTIAFSKEAQATADDGRRRRC